MFAPVLSGVPGQMTRCPCGFGAYGLQSSSASSINWYASCRGTMCRGWEGNRRSGVEVAICHRLKWLGCLYGSDSITVPSVVNLSRQIHNKFNNLWQLLWVRVPETRKSGGSAPRPRWGLCPQTPRSPSTHVPSDPQSVGNSLGSSTGNSKICGNFFAFEYRKLKNLGEILWVRVPDTRKSGGPAPRPRWGLCPQAPRSP